MPMMITVPDIDGWDNDTEHFVKLKGATFAIEHSLISIQKWESKWHKSYLNSTEKTVEEIIDYIRCMTLTPGIDSELYKYIPKSELQRIKEYLEDPMTATTINERKKEGESPHLHKHELITAETIYYLMIEYGIPVEYRKWHINQLMTLIKVCQIKGEGPQKMSRADVMALHRATNNARRKGRR